MNLKVIDLATEFFQSMHSSLSREVQPVHPSWVARILEKMRERNQVKHKGLADHVADFVVDLIATRKLIAGQRIYEKDIAATLGVSHIPVREGLRVLHAQGVVKIIPNRGVFIAEPAMDETSDLADLRLSLEGLAARRLVHRLRSEPNVIELLGRNIDGMRAAAENDDRLAFYRADLAFHSSVIELSQSMLLRPTWEAVSRVVFLFMMTGHFKPIDYESSIIEHQVLLELISAGNLEQLNNEMRDHVMGYS